MSIFLSTFQQLLVQTHTICNWSWSCLHTFFRRHFSPRCDLDMLFSPMTKTNAGRLTDFTGNHSLPLSFCVVFIWHSKVALGTVAFFRPDSAYCAPWVWHSILCFLPLFFQFSNPNNFFRLQRVKISLFCYRKLYSGKIRKSWKIKKMFNIQ